MNKKELQEKMLELINSFEESSEEKVSHIDIYTASIVDSSGNEKEWPKSRALHVRLIGEKEKEIFGE